MALSASSAIDRKITRPVASSNGDADASATDSFESTTNAAIFRGVSTRSAPPGARDSR